MLSPKACRTFHVRNIFNRVLAHKRRKRLMAISQRVRAESMKVNAEFGAVEGHPVA